LLPIVAPLPDAPPCILQRPFPRTAGDWQSFPLRVRAPHRGARFIGEFSRCVGSFLRFFLHPHPPGSRLRRSPALIAGRAAWGRGGAGPVPCGACTACCHYPAVIVDEKRDRKRLARLLTERSPDGELVLQRRSDGAGVHLGTQGCTVYEQRPAVCRTFDCRIFAAMGLIERCGPNHQTPHWEFAGH
jgi:hypothetical protein